VAGIPCRIYTVHLVRSLAELSKSHVLADSSIDYGAQRAIFVTRFAVLGFHEVSVAHVSNRTRWTVYLPRVIPALRHVHAATNLTPSWFPNTYAAPHYCFVRLNPNVPPLSGPRLICLIGGWLHPFLLPACQNYPNLAPWGVLGKEHPPTTSSMQSLLPLRSTVFCLPLHSI
jgi:hypothetical protein